MYLLFASLLVYTFFDYFSSTEGGCPLVDAFYMTFVTTFTIGYGDIVPREVPSKILCDVLVVIGHVVPFIFFYYMDQIAQRWDRMITSTIESERSRLLSRVLSAIVVILVVIFSGVAGIYIFERDQPVLSPSPSLSPFAMAPSPTDVRTQLGFWDIFHLSVMTVTSAGYGDVSFVTVYGRSFAIFWIPFSVTIYSVAMTYLTRHTLRAFRVYRYITGIPYCRQFFSACL